MEYSVFRIRDICEIKSGKRLPAGADFVDYKTNRPYIRARDIKDGKIKADNLAYIEDSVQSKIKKYIINSGDIAITIVGSVGNVGFALDEVNGFNLTENAVRLTEFRDMVDSRFLSHLLYQKQYHDYMQLIAGAAAQPKLGIYKIQRIKVQLPDITVQNRIADILSAYDELIENNNKRIKILEQMAENLYKEWFVRFRFPGHETTEFENGIPKGWGYKTVENLSCILQRGISPEYDDNGELTVISQKCIREGIMDISEARAQIKKFRPELNIHDGDCVICSTGTGTLGRVGQVYGDYPGTTFDSHVTLVRAKDSIGKHFLFWTLKNMQPWFMNMGIGSTNQQELYRSTIKNAKALVPDEASNLIEKFDCFIAPIHKEICNLRDETQNLIKQRNLLLPRLMSGKFEV